MAYVYVMPLLHQAFSQQKSSIFGFHHWKWLIHINNSSKNNCPERFLRTILKLSVTLKGNNPLEVTKGEFKDPGVTYTRNAKITYEINNNSYSNVSDLESAINSLDTGTYTLTYKATLNGESATAIRKIIIK